MTETAIDVLTVAEAARRLRVSKSHLYHEIAAGHLPAVRLGPRVTRVTAADLSAYIDARRASPHPAA